MFTGAPVLLGRARRQSAVPELGGRTVPGEATSATVAAARQRGAVLSGPVGRGAQGAEAVQRAEETRRPGTRHGQATGGLRAMCQRKFNRFTVNFVPGRSWVIREYVLLRLPGTYSS